MVEDRPYPIPRPADALERLANRLELLLRRESPEDQQRVMQGIIRRYSDQDLLLWVNPDTSSPAAFARSLIGDNEGLDLEHLDFRMAMRSEFPEELVAQLIPPDGHLETWDDLPARRQQAKKQARRRKLLPPKAAAALTPTPSVAQPRAAGAPEASHPDALPPDELARQTGILLRDGWDPDYIETLTPGSLHWQDLLERAARARITEPPTLTPEELERQTGILRRAGWHPDDIERLKASPQQWQESIEQAAREGITDPAPAGDGTRNKPVKVVSPGDVQAAEEKVNTEAPPAGCERQIGSSPSGSTWRPYRTVILCVLACVAFAYWTFFSRKSETANAPAVPEIPGWDDLFDCSRVTSFDGTKSLFLSNDHRALLYSEGPLREPLEGSWSFDPLVKRYAVTQNGETMIYSILSPPGVGTCMLIKGDLEQADLRQSWFSSTGDPPEYDPPDYGRSE